MSVALAPMIPAATASVTGGHPGARDALAQLLINDGFRIVEVGSTDGLIVLITAATEAKRLREIRTLVERHPNCSVLSVLPASTSNASLRRSLLAGSAGIVHADEAAAALVPTARAILVGQLAVPSALGREIAPRPLSHREKQILGLVVEGLTNREIANRLFLAESTIKTHLSSAFRKIDARSRAEAVARIHDPESTYGPSILALVDADLGRALTPAS